jgi:hypothetical protein
MLPFLRPRRPVASRGRIGAIVPSAGRPVTELPAATEDALISAPRFGRALAAGIPGACHVEIPDAAHGVSVLAPPARAAGLAVAGSSCAALPATPSPRQPSARGEHAPHTPLGVPVY